MCPWNPPSRTNMSWTDVSPPDANQGVTYWRPIPNTSLPDLMYHYLSFETTFMTASSLVDVPTTMHIFSMDMSICWHVCMTCWGHYSIQNETATNHCSLVHWGWSHGCVPSSYYLFGVHSATCTNHRVLHHSSMMTMTPALQWQWPRNRLPTPGIWT